ncbi:MAG: hypothetical protein R3275_10455 [Saprospiraceae bacterium]|nr:hypothetical protein [Saprospiraceae bacterium]
MRFKGIRNILKYELVVGGIVLDFLNVVNQVAEKMEQANMEIMYVMSMFLIRMLMVQGIMM